MSGNKKDISVIITTYNEEKFIAEALMSVVNQTLNPLNFEIIVVDDGGTDNTDKVLNSLKKEHNLSFRYMKKKNGGTASARNFGVANSTGEFIAFLDGDDSYLPNKLVNSARFMAKGGNIGIVYSDYIEKYNDKSNYRLKQNFDRDKLFSECIISTNSMVRRSALDKVGGLDETFKYVEDYDLWCRIVMSGYFALRVPEPLFVYNSHAASKTNSTNFDKIKPEWARITERISKNEWHI